MSKHHLTTGAIIDPADRRYCYVFDALGALFIGPALFGGAEAAGLGAAAAGLGETAAAGFGAGLLGDVAGAGALGAVGGGALPALSIGAGAAALPEVLGGSSSGLADLATGISGGFADAFGAAPSAGLDFGGTGLGAEALAPQGANLGLEQAVGPIVPSASGTSVGGPLAGAPAAPASVGGASSTATGLGLDTAGTGFTGGAPAQAGTSGVGASADFGGGAASGGSTLGSSTPSTVSRGVSGLTSGLDKAISSGTGGFLNLKDVGSIASLGGLGMNLLNRPGQLPGQGNLTGAAHNIENAAANLANTGAGIVTKGNQLENFINTGALPPGLQQGLKTATESAKASIRSNYAQRGMSGSSAEAQDMQAAEDRAAAAGASLALQLLQQGASMVAQGTSTVGQAINAESLSAQLYNDIMRNALAEDQDLQRSIAAFSGVLAGMGGSQSGNTVTIKAA